MGIINLRSINIIEGRPKIEADEMLLHRAFEGKASAVLLGTILTFIPPFLWGPLIIGVTLYLSRHSGVMVTNRRIVSFHKYFRPGKYSVLEIPLSHLIEIRVARITRGDVSSNLVDRLFGSGDVEVHWEDETGTRMGIFPTIKKPKQLVHAAASAREKLAFPAKPGNE